MADSSNDLISSVRAKLRLSLESLDQDQAARAVRKQLSDDELEAAISHFLKWEAWAILRDGQLEIERAAIRDVAAKQRESVAVAAVAANGQQELLWIRLYSRPEDYYGTSRDKDFYPNINNVRDRKAFRKWCKDSGRDFDEWLARAMNAADTEQHAGWHDRAHCEMDWDPEGPMAASEKRQRSIVMSHVTELVSVVASETRLKVTAELLGSEFALGDGRRVTWGMATREEHRQRIELLKRNAGANIEAASRHQQAIAMLEASGAECLREVECQPAGNRREQAKVG